MRFRPKVAVQALHHCLGRSGSPTMDARRAFLAIAVACAAAQRWCDANLFAPPRPAIELPMELAHAGGVATQTVWKSMPSRARSCFAGGALATRADMLNGLPRAPRRSGLTGCPDFSGGTTGATRYSIHLARLAWLHLNRQRR